MVKARAVDLELDTPDPDGLTFAQLIKARLVRAWTGEWEELRQDFFAD